MAASHSAAMARPSTETRIIMKRLCRLNIPLDYVEGQHRGLVAYVKEHENDVDMGDIIRAIFPTNVDIEDISFFTRQRLFQESMIWVKWLMFRGDPVKALVESFSESGVCGWVSRMMDLKYRCLTCELHPNSTICVPCFERRDHCKEEHDFRFIFSAGGSCDCGDVVAMKSSGFCSNHQGNEQIQSLPTKFASSIRSTLDLLFRLWRDRLVDFDPKDEVQTHSTFEVVKFLLELCGQSKILGSLISEIMFSLTDLTDTLFKMGQFFNILNSGRIRELLLKLLILGEVQYQRRFAIVFLRYYPRVVANVIEKRDDEIFKKHPLMNTFSLEIFTRPALTLQLVEEDNLLSVLLSECLEKILESCVGEDGRLEILTWKRLYKTTIRVVENIRFIMSHSDVPKYVIREQKGITRAWMRILNFVQGLNPLKRGTSRYIKDQPFVLGHCLAQIHSHLVDGAFSEDVEELEDPDSVRPAKLPRISQDCSVSRLTGTSRAADTKHDYGSIPLSVTWLTFECLKTIDRWLVLSLGQETGGSGSGSGSNETSTVGLKVLSLNEWTDPISQDISVHIPLHRLLAMVLQRSLKNYYGESTSRGLAITSSHDFFSLILEGCHPCGFSASIMEHPLRIRVFCAQVRAGMWKKRHYGNSAISCRESYLHKSWSDEKFRSYENGLELDLFLLQCCAAIAPESDRYVKRILERYGLSEYVNLNNPEGSIEYEPVLVQEMLILMIQIVQERRFCDGLTTAECLRREIIHKLSVADATYSEVMNSIPKDLLENINFQEILYSVAEYTSPVGLKTGMFKLQPEYWKELNLYHLRWEAKDFQEAEERYFKSCKVSALTTQLPSWSKTYPSLSGISHIATCKTMLEIIRAVLFYALFWDKSTPEFVVWAAMHMLSLALDICSQLRASGQSEATPILEFASEEISASGNANESLLSLLVTLMRREKGAVDFDLFSLCINTLKKFKELEPHKISAQVASELFDGSMLASNKEKGKAKQAAVLEMLKAQQEEFAKKMDTDDAATGENLETKESRDGEDECVSCRETHTNSPMYIIVHLQKSRLLSLLDRGPVEWKPNSASARSATTSPLPMSSDSSHQVQRATLRFAKSLSSQDALVEVSSTEELEERMLTRMRRGESSGESSIAGETQGRGSQSVLLQSYLDSLVEERIHQAQSSGAYDGFSPKDCDGIYISSCGHTVHQSCLKDFLLVKRKNGPREEQILDSAKIEFSCPKCRRLANSILPTLPREGKSSEKVTPSDPGIFSSSSSTGEETLRILDVVSLMHDAAAGVQESISLIPFQQLERQQLNLDPVFHTLGSMYPPDKAKAFESGRVNRSLLLWDILKYSIVSTEIAARSVKWLRPSGSILSVLLKTVQSSKMKSRPTTFLRYRGIQLYEKSLCSGLSNDECKRQEVDTLLSLEKSYSEANFPDIQFWKMASDPVLAHDSFESLMWTLFCLPNSFLSNKKVFFSLVHIFYLVTITQGIVICCRKRNCSLPELALKEGLKDCLITDICKLILDHKIHFEKIDSNYVNSSGDIMETIRSLSMPFLRRCLLLWQLNSSEDTVRNESLESVFQIPPIDSVINDDISRVKSKLWLQNFLQEYNSRQGHVLYCSPSEPFKLLVLPKYEELLKRYNNQHCPYCSKFLDKPALCLICGKLCESSSESCCREVNCELHAKACGAGVGVFLMIQVTSTLLQSADEIALWPSLYLNEFGEEDVDLKQGRPLSLWEARRDILNHMVASHGLENEVFQYKHRPDEGEEEEEEEDDDEGEEEDEEEEDSGDVVVEEEDEDDHNIDIN